MLTVRNLAGLEEPLVDVKELNVNRKVNGEKTLTLKVVPTKQNSEAFKMVEEEATLIFQDNEYVIKKISQRSSGNSYTKNVTAIHKFFTDMIDSRQRNVHNGSLTFANALKFIFEGSNYTYVIGDQFNAETFENFGGENRLALLQTILERYQAEMEISGKQVNFKKKIGNDTDFQFRYGHNVKTFSRDIDTSNLSTYIKGYGKKKEETDVLSGTTMTYESRTGTFYTEPGINKLATEQVGASFKFSFTGTGFNWRTVVIGWGGIWEFTIDKNTSVNISTYVDTAELTQEKTFEIIRGLENKKHDVVATFKGKDSKSWYTSPKGGNIKATGYLLSNNPIGLYRELVGDEVYQAVVDYTSPNAELYGLRDAGDVVDERFTKQDSLLEEIKSRLQDVPEKSITIDFVDLRAAGYPYTVPNEGDRVFTIYEPVEDLVIENRILEIDEEYKPIDAFPYYIPIRTKVTLANYKKTFSGTMLGTVQKALKSIVDSNGKVKSSVLDDAVLEATKALQSAQTEVEFINGFLLRSKEDPNDLMVINSAGIGLSDDGGNSFGQAMTAKGFVADYITTGTLRAIIIEGVEIYGSLFESAASPTVYTRIQGAAVENRGQWTRTWRGETEKHDVTVRLFNGILRFENPEKERAISILDNGISTFADGDGGGSSSGTIEFFSRRFSEVNGLTMYSSGTYGVDASEIVSQAQFSQTIESNESQIYMRPNRTNRPGNNTFAWSVLNETEEHLTDGFLAYGSTATGYASGFRFSKRASEPVIWAVDGDLSRYGTTKIGAGYFMGYMAMSHTGENFYLGSTDEIRSVRATSYQDGIIAYIDHRAANFHNASSITYKTDFKKPELSGRYVINKLNVVDYVLKSDLEEGNYSNRQIGVVSELSPEIATTDGMAISLYKGWSYNVMATQELSIEVDKHANDIRGIFDTIKAIVDDYAKLDSRISALEVS